MHLWDNTVFPLEKATILQSSAQPNTEPSPAAAAAAAAQVTGSTRTRFPYAMPGNKWMRLRSSSVVGRRRFVFFSSPRSTRSDPSWMQKLCKCNNARRAWLVAGSAVLHESSFVQSTVKSPTYARSTRNRQLFCCRGRLCRATSG